MSRKRTEENLDFETDYTPTGPVRQRRIVRVKATRSRTAVRRKTRATESKTPKVAGMHQRSNKRISW